MIDDPVKVNLDGLDFNLVRQDESDQAVFGPRFGSGSEDETDLTLQKTLTFESGDDGSFTVPRSGELTPYLVDGITETKPKSLSILENEQYFTAAVTAGLNPSSATASYQFQDVTYVAGRDGNKNWLAYINSDGTGLQVTPITLPSALLNSTQMINSFGEKDGLLYLCTLGVGYPFYFSATATVVQVSGGTSGFFKQIFNLNGHLYAVNQQDVIYEWVGTTSSHKYTKIASMDYAKAGTQLVWPVDVLNGRAYIGQPTALWAFDGVRTYIVIDERRSPSLNNFKFVQALDGYLYFNKRYAFYRFNGSSVEKLMDFPIATNFLHARAFEGSLYILTRPTYDDEIEQERQAGGYPFTPPGAPGTYDVYTYGYRLFRYDGINMYLYKQRLDVTFNYLTTLGEQYEKIFTYSDPNTGWTWVGVWLNQGSGSGGYRRFRAFRTDPNYIDSGFLIADPKGTAIFNEVDMGLPTIEKLVRNIRIDMVTTTAASTTNTVEVYYKTSKTGAWSLFGTTTTDSTSFYMAAPAGLTKQRRIWFKVMINKKSVTLRRFVLYYIICAPSYTQFNLVLSPPANTVAVPNAQSVTYRNKIKTLRSNQTPFVYTDSDGNTFNCIVDSYTIMKLPTQDETVDQSQYSLVLREV